MEHLLQTYGVIGYPLTGTLSPMLHGLIYKETGVKAAYGRFPVDPDKVDQVLDSMRVLNIRGINVTIPHKQTIMKQLDKLSPEAEKIGAVNTVDLQPDGTATGYNTDYFGFLKTLEHYDIPVQGKRFVLCGMGGAGRAVWHSLQDNGAAEVLVASTDPEKGVPYESLTTVEGFDTIINCAPLGMAPGIDKCVVDVDVLERFENAVDIVYNPMDTLFLQRARQCGAKKAAGGLMMLIYQGIKSFEIWTGKTVSDDVAVQMYEQLKDQFA